MKSKLSISLCIALHAILVLIFAAITVTYETGALNTPLRLSQGTLRAILSIVSQAFTIAYCAALVWLTQRITLHEFTKYPQTLTSIHDKSSAWLGLGSSLQTMGRQVKLASDLLGVSMITVYLLLIFVVHTTLPSIFTFTSQNVTSVSAYPTTLSRQDVISELVLGAGNGVDDLNEVRIGLTNLYAILQVYDALNFPTVGVADSMLYDIIPIIQNPADADVEVNATTFSVDCASLPGAVQESFVYPNATPSQQAPYTFEFDDGKYTFSVTAMGINQFQVLPVINSSLIATDESNDLANLSTLIVATTYPLVDSAANNVTSQAVSINPIWKDSETYGEFHEITGINVVGCNFDVHNSTVHVNAQSRTVNQSSFLSMPVGWHEWAEPGTSEDLLLMETLQAFISNVPSVSSIDDPTLGIPDGTVDIIAYVRPHSLIEQFLQMDIATIRNANLNVSGPITLDELNRCLGRAFAAVLWFYNSASPTSLELVFSDVGAKQRQGQALIPSSVPQERLTVNKISLFAGLAASCALFVLAIGMIIKSGGFVKNDIHHDISGLLPILWFLGHEPRLIAVQHPDLDALRTAGMFKVTGISHSGQHTYTSNGKGQDAEYELGSLTEPMHSSDPLLRQRKNHVCPTCGTEC
ncbi:hypothetical protein NM688_g2385 [Phlebia brevispora]|uniref:Uncharacterized protein n=1 Tax=Phlebia brevispora TaxID=194682 RepID=A0ACC1T8M6_9APHY|nr:hypothetical protein NM688_g2385 [Phlebia brevispora]